MMLFSVVFTLIFSFQGFAASLPLMIESHDAARSEIRKLQIPNNQITQIGSKEYRLETGNNNLLRNPSFEAPIVEGIIPGWTKITGDAIVSLASTAVKDGKYALQIGLIGDPITYCQHSTINADGFSTGIDGSYGAFVDNQTGIPVYVCPANSGVMADASQCSEVKSLAGFQEVLESVRLAGTSNGICITTNGVGAGSLEEPVYLKVDDAKLEPGSLKGVRSKIERQVLEYLSTANSTTYDLADGEIAGEGLFSVSGNELTAIKKIKIDASVSASGVSTGTTNTQISASITYGSNVWLDRGNTGTAAAGSRADAVSSVSLVLEPGEKIAFTTSTNGSPTLDKKVVSVTATLESSESVYQSTIDNKLDVIFSVRSTAPNGYISASNKTIGLTGADYSGSEYFELYKNIWELPGLTVGTSGKGFLISSAKGASASADWAAGKLILINYEDLYPRGASATNTAGSYQENQNKAHTHNLYHRESAPASGTSSIVIGGNYSNQSGTGVTQSSGGSEARPETGVLYAYIRYKAEDVKAYFSQFDYVRVEAGSDSGQSIGTSSGVVIFEDEIKDTHNAYDPVTGIFKAPMKGLYSYQSATLTNPLNITGGQRFFCNISENSVVTRATSRSNGTGSNNNHHGGASIILDLEKDDEVNLNCASSVSTTLTSDSTQNWLSITRIPGQFR